MLPATLHATVPRCRVVLPGELTGQPVGTGLRADSIVMAEQPRDGSSLSQIDRAGSELWSRIMTDVD